MMLVRRLLAAVVVAAASGCGGAPSAPSSEPARAVAGWPSGRVASPALDDAAPLFAPVSIGADQDTLYLVSFRFAVLDGSVEATVTDSVGKPIATRRVSRLGENLASMIVSNWMEYPLKVSLSNPGKCGPVEVDAGSVQIQKVTAANAAATAAAIAVAFEADTGRLGDPAVDNLVPNADFGADDELRGTPADWSAYVETSLDPVHHTLAVRGAPPSARPYLSTGPVRLKAGRRYRAHCRLRVVEGSVRLRAVDYDEIEILAETDATAATAEMSDLTLEFTAPANAKAVRLALAPVEPGAAVSLELHTMQLELLPGARR